MPTTPGAQTFRELENWLSSSMARRSRPAVKTYLVEPTTNLSGRDHQEFLRRSFRAASPRRRVAVTALVGNADIYEVLVGKVALWVETGDDRFWQVHSVDETTVVASIVDRWIALTPELDAPWFPEQLLRTVAGVGEFIGFGLSYSRAYFADDPDEAESLSVRVSGSESRVALKDLQGQHTFLRASALSMVRVRNPFAGPGATEVGRITTSLTARGRVSSRGDSFGRHRDFLRYGAELYRATEARIADTMSIGGLESSGEGLRGPIVVRLASPVDDLGAFCGRLFSGGDPFRLWGFLERRSPDLIVANAFDQRSGASFTVEATSTALRIFLPTGTSGTVVLRLVTLLQQHHDRRAEVEGLLG
jgi:hypothetical protein